MTIQERIEKLKAEKTALTQAHEAMVQEQEKRHREFQQQVGKNQQRFQQLDGAITELESMLHEHDYDQQGEKKDGK